MGDKSKFLISQFKISEEDVKKINEFCKKASCEKYIIWVAKEFKSNNDIIDDTQKILFIFDWVKRKKANILNYTYQEALEESETWHKDNFKILEREDNIKEGEDTGIIYRCRDGKHFFKILSPDDLKEEGDLMGNCIGGNDYVEKLKKYKSIIISLRDEKNLPHVDIEIDVRDGKSLQVFGKANLNPTLKYQYLITEYVLNVVGYDKKIDNEIKKILFEGKISL